MIVATTEPRLSTTMTAMIHVMGFFTVDNVRPRSRCASATERRMQSWIETAREYLHEHALDWVTSAALGLATILVGWIVARLASAAVRRALRRTHAITLAPMMGTLTRITVLGFAVVMGLDQMGLDITTVLAGASVIGLAVGFGAQQLVKDCISGFFLVVEQIIEEEDWVDIDGKFGKVEHVGLRMTQLRSFDGTLWSVPNGEVKTVGNLSADWVRVICEISVAYEQDAQRGLQVLQDVGDWFAKEHAELIFDNDVPTAQGILELGSSSVDLRLVCKIKHTAEGEKWPTERMLRREIKAAFDREGIEIPFPRQVTYHRQEDDSALRIESHAA